MKTAEKELRQTRCEKQKCRATPGLKRGVAAHYFSQILKEIIPSNCRLQASLYRNKRVQSQCLHGADMGVLFLLKGVSRVFLT